jgi:clan AA aspartic protease
MASIAGRVNERLEAVVAVRLVAGAEVECLVDTGFSGALVLPQELVERLGLPVFGYEDRLEMVGGAETSAALALAQIEWLGEVRSVAVIVKDDFLVGTQLLEDAKPAIDYPERTLTIAQAEEGA